MLKIEIKTLFNIKVEKDKSGYIFAPYIPVMKVETINETQSINRLTRSRYSTSTVQVNILINK